MSYTIQDMVYFGSQYLDRAFSGWENIVSIADLDMDNYERCVLGQIAKSQGLSFHGLWGKIVLGYDDTEFEDMSKENDVMEYSFGFNPYVSFNEKSSEEYPEDDFEIGEKLSMEWAKAIRERRNV